MLQTRFNFMRSWVALCLVAMASALAGCGGCGGDPGQSVFGVSCGDANAGGGSAPGFTFASGSGPSVLRVPSGVTQMSVRASAAAVANFAVRVDGRLLINEVIGPSETPPTFSGTYTVAPGAVIEVFQASGVDWTLTSAGVDQAGPQKLSRSGSGDAVFVLPARSARYTISGTSLAGARNFVVRVGGRLIVNEIVGVGGWSGAFLFQAQEQVEISNSTGVQWSFVELD